MRRALIGVLAAAGLAAGCSPGPAAQRQSVSPAIAFDCDGFELRIARTNGAIVVDYGGDSMTLRQSRQDPLRYEGGGNIAVFAPNRTFLEWTAGGGTATCIADG